MRKWLKKNWRLIIGIGFISLILIFFIWKVPEWFVSPSCSLPEGSKDLLETRDNYRKTIIQIIGGVAILIGLYLTYRRTKAIEDTTRSQFKALEIAAEGQITERFTKAVAQLGNNDRLEIRLGGIYALERIAHDSKTDHWTIMEVLTAFVRENSRIKDENNSEEKKDNTPEKPIKPDIQAILTIISRRKWVEDERQRIDLNSSYLKGVNIGEKAKLQKANLAKANLKEANLKEANLRGANLEGANLEGANLWRAKLGGAKLGEANLGRADLRGANLHRANLYGADLYGADLYGADLWIANLGGANLWRANLGEANLGGADLRGAKKLKLEQLSKVKMLYEAKLDSSLLEQVKKKYPHLLEEPKKE